MVLMQNWHVQQKQIPFTTSFTTSTARFTLGIVRVTMRPFNPIYTRFKCCLHAKFHAFYDVMMDTNDMQTTMPK